MRLLVSVRSAAEVEAAVEGGAEIIDAKEPMRGSLGAVDAGTLALIVKALPDEMPLSIALGDHATPDAAARAMDLLQAVARRPAELYVKIGLAGVVEPATARSVVQAAVRAARSSPLGADVVAVAYADHRFADTLSPQLLLDIAVEAGARGVLMDTWSKDGRPLFASATHSDIRRWLEGARSRGLLTALAGSLTRDQMDDVRTLGPDVVGVRGAACEKGRGGVMNARLVQQLSTAINCQDSSRAIV
jgi:(5-formylfuran-3-yl)methyl phosphate synthase